jgi:hypothetical protein
MFELHPKHGLAGVLCALGLVVAAGHAAAQESCPASDPSCRPAPPVRTDRDSREAQRPGNLHYQAEERRRVVLPPPACDSRPNVRDRTVVRTEPGC